MRGQNPLHLAASSGREAAASLLALFLQCMPDYPINAPDIEGNSRNMSFLDAVCVEYDFQQHAFV